jgi:8-oxo-dGTP diphosphatase
MPYPIRVGANALIVRNDTLLLVEFNDASGLRYNLPGGGVEAGESIREGLQREVREETCTEVTVGELAFVCEYEPQRNEDWAGTTHKLSLIFKCTLEPDSEPCFPSQPDPHQTAVRWIPLNNLTHVELLPHLGTRLLDYLEHPAGATFLEEPLEPERIRRYLNP